MQKPQGEFFGFTSDEMTNDFYHNRDEWPGEYVSGSDLAKIHSTCFAKWKHEEKSSTDALEFGTQSHTNFESKELFMKTYRRAPDANDYENPITSQAALAAKLKSFGLTGTSGKQYPELIKMLVDCGENLNVMWLIDMIAQCQAWADGVELIDAQKYDDCVAMRQVLEYIPEHNACMNSQTAHREFSLFGTIDGVEVKIRIDHVDICNDPVAIAEYGYDPEIHPEIVVITDYKTTQTANPDENEFPRLAFNLGYYLKMALQRDLFVRCFNEKRPVVVQLLAQEKKPPYLPMSFQMDDEQLIIGRSQYMSVIHQYKACKSHNVWPSYNNGAARTKMATPEWVRRKYKHLLEPQG